MRVIPYMELDGIKTLKDSELAYLYDRMVVDKTMKWMSIRNMTRDEWVWTAKRSTNLFVAYEDKPIGVAWINDFSEGVGLVDFCMFSEVWGRSEYVVKEMLDFVMKTGQWETLMGVTAKSNRIAVSFLPKVGFKIMCTLPKIIRVGDRWDDGVISLYRREP